VVLLGCRIEEDVLGYNRRAAGDGREGGADLIGAVNINDLSVGLVFISLEGFQG
jgi:hypothetical protein